VGFIIFQRTEVRQWKGGAQSHGEAAAAATMATLLLGWGGGGGGVAQDTTQKMSVGAAEPNAPARTIKLHWPQRSVGRTRIFAVTKRCRCCSGPLQADDAVPLSSLVKEMLARAELDSNERFVIPG
jgi:hypothetical protein